MAIPVNRLIITRKSANHWVYVLNDEPDTRDANAYTGNRNGNLITINTITGAIILPDVYYSVISYYSEVDPSKNMVTPVSAELLQGHLIEETFFRIPTGGTGGGGSGGVDEFKQLTDVDVPSFTGRNGQILYIDGLFIRSMQNPLLNINLQDLANYLNPGYFPPDSYLITGSQTDGSGNATGFGVAPILNLIDRPAEFNEARFFKKGYQYIDGDLTPNQDIYVQEVGDYFQAMIINTDGYPVLYTGRWKGGDLTDLASIEWGDGDFYPMEGEPGYEESN